LVLGVVVLALLAILVLGAVTGRVQMRSCCSIADPRRDLRMRSASTDDAASKPQS
jgi:hypothetical protein